MRYEILDDKGKVINTILAEPSFVEAKYPGRYRPGQESVEKPPVPTVDPLAEIKNKLDQIIAETAIIKDQTKK